MGAKAKNGLLFILFAALFLPLLQSEFPFIKSAPLNGEFTSAPDTSFTLKTWFDESYWYKKNLHINDSMGFRPDFIRLNNQLDYSLFKKIHSEWRLMGENSCIFQDVYIYSYLGRDYDGYAYIYEKVRKLKAVQDTLAKLGKSLIFVQAPCKAFYYPEYFPKRYKDTVKGMSNYEQYARLADSFAVNQIDFNAWFRGMKTNSKELLYPKQGFHWSTYGSLLAGDSLVRYMERQRHIHMIHPYWNEIEHTTKPRFKDNDIAKSMNLLFPLTTETFSYPVLQYTADATATKPKVIYVGDSFLFQWLDEWLIQNTSSHWQIWYYNQSVVDKDHARDERFMPSMPSNFDRQKEIDSADCIVIMFTSRNMTKMGQNFVETVYDHYFPAKK